MRPDRPLETKCSAVSLGSKRGAGWWAAPKALAIALLALSATAATTVHLGSVRQITGPADLDLDGEFIYAINFSADDPVRTVRGVRFLPDTQTIPGASLVGPQHVTPWQTKPEFGASADANQLEEILSDIRWANAGNQERLRATLSVTAGDEYKLQILFSANTAEDRRWDVRVNHLEAVDEITSLGAAPGQAYARNRATLYTCQFTAPTATVVVEMGDLFGHADGGDRNPIWQALTLERITAPPTPDDIVLEPDRFFPTQTLAVGRLRAVDRRYDATHVFAFVAGAGDQDNGKFALAGADLLPGTFDFRTTPVGTVFTIRVRATDDAAAHRALEKTLTLTLAAPHSPTALSLDATSLSTLAQAGACVGRVTVEDADAFDRHRLELVSGAGNRDNALFLVHEAELRLAQRLPPDLIEAQFRLRAADLSGRTIERALVLPLAEPRLLINELLASEVAGLPDEYSEPQEWVELVNDLAQYIDLAGWYLTDDRDNLRKWRFPAGVIPPGGYQVILADGRASTPEGSTNLHANFALDAQGEWIGLLRPDGETLASALEFPAQYPGVAYGFGPDGRVGHLPRPTPWAANGPVAQAGLNQVHFSRDHGYTTNAFDLELTATLPDSIVRYTLDGTLPTPTRGAIYAKPITIKPNSVATTRGTRIVRALAVHPEAAYAPVATRSYLFIKGVAGPSVDGLVSQSWLLASITRHATYGPLLEQAFLALPALSLVMPGGPAAVERAASIELFDPGHREAGFQIDCGIEATGTSSLGSPKLSMAAHFRLEYGSAKLRYPLFAQGSLFSAGAASVFNQLRLRSHSHDTFYWLATSENPPVPYGSPPVNRSGDAQLARNVWIDEMQLALGQPGKRGRQVHLFLNGAYHGIYHLHERADADFMAAYFPGAREDYHHTTAASSGSEHDDGESWATIWNILKSSLSSYAEAKRWIDVTNLCDYMLLSFYAGNDWDWSERHNWSAAGPRLPDRGGWKFFQQDSDICLQDVAADCTDQNVPDGIFTSLMRFKDFQVLFRDRIQKHCYGDGALTPARAGALYDARMNELATAIVAETARWQPSSSVAALPWDRDQEWTNEWRYLRDTFFPQRTARVIAQFRQRGWWPLAPPTPSAPGGGVPAGLEVTLTSTQGTVYFTTDGSDPRLPGGGINPAARSTASGAVSFPLIPAGAVWRFLDDGTQPDPAWKEPGFDDSTWRSGPAEIGYGDGNEATTSGYVDADLAAAGVQKNITTYFRRAFDVSDAPGTTELHLRLLRDDGALVCLNGREIWRVNLPEGAITPETRAVMGIGGADETTWLEQTLMADPLLLRAAGNVLAVEVHQQSPESSDISFDFEMMGRSAGTATNSFIAIDQPTLVRARTYANADWSGMVESLYIPEGAPPASAANLLLAEIQYHPLDEPDAEFLEFLNPSLAAVDLSDVAIANAVRFSFPQPTVLGAGQRLVVAKDPTSFSDRYASTGSPYFRDGIRLLGPWQGSLSNGGEVIEVLGPDGSPLFACGYGTDGEWPRRADGRGSSLELVDWASAPTTPAERTAWLSNPAHWRPSAEFHGSPGAPGTGPDRRVVINELLAAPAPPATDAVELLNRSPTAILASGWFLSDSSADYRKYRLTDGLLLEPGSRLVLREADFNEPGNPACLVPFALNAQGDDLFLVRAAAAGALLGFVDCVEFGRSPIGVSLGRFPDGTGPLVRLEQPSFGTTNGPPALGYEAWAAVAFPPDTPLEQTLPDADPDLDGLSNFAEYAFVLLPDRPSPPALERAAAPGLTGLAFTYRTRTGAADLIYHVEVSVDLQSWEAGSSEVEEIGRTPLPDGATQVTARLRTAEPSAQQRRFLRIGAVQRSP